MGELVDLDAVLRAREEVDKEAMAELRKLLNELEEEVKTLTAAFEQTMEERDRARYEASYWQSVAEGEIER